MNLTFRNMNIKTFLAIATLCLLIWACNIGKTDIAAEKPADTTKPAESTTTTNLDDAVQGYLGDDKSKKKNKQPKEEKAGGKFPNNTRSVTTVTCVEGTVPWQQACSQQKVTIGKGVKVLDSN